MNFCSCVCVSDILLKYAVFFFVLMCSVVTHLISPAAKMWDVGISEDCSAKNIEKCILRKQGV